MKYIFTFIFMLWNTMKKPAYTFEIVLEFYLFKHCFTAKVSVSYTNS